MRLVTPTPARKRGAALAFALSLITSLLVWNNGHQAGLAELRKPEEKTATIDQNYLDQKSVTDYRQKLTQLQAQIPQTKTAKEQLALSSPFFGVISSPSPEAA